MTPEVSLELSYAFLTSFIAYSLYSDLLFIVQSLSRVQLFAALHHARLYIYIYMCMSSYRVISLIYIYSNTSSYYDF